jgi:hypothetical protein
MGLAFIGSHTAESLGANTMPSLKVPVEIRRALALKTAERYNITTAEALMWIHDIEDKGTKSIFFEQVKPIAQEFFAPILSAVLPAIGDIISAAVAAGIVKARVINDGRGADEAISGE